MASVFCPACGKSVDVSADRCPHCGHAMRELTKEKPSPLVITCPQCGKEYGRDFSSCPHCGHHIDGHVAKAVPTTSSPSEPPPPGHTRLGPSNGSSIGGLLMIALGVLCLFYAIVFPPLILGCLLFIGAGANVMHGERSGTCPYCGLSVSIPSDKTSCKCPHCKKVSVKTGDFLKRVD